MEGKYIKTPDLIIKTCSTQDVLIITAVPRVKVLYHRLFSLAVPTSPYGNC